MIFAIDPGTVRSGWVLLDGMRVVDSGVHENADLLRWVQAGQGADVLAIEMIASYGMAVGREVFETVRWIGRFQQAWRNPDDVHLVYRAQVKLHLCKTPQAKDVNVRRALLDMFPAIGGGKTPQVGTKGKPGPLYGVNTHAWAALGVALTCAHRNDAARLMESARLLHEELEAA